MNACMPSNQAKHNFCKSTTATQPSANVCLVNTLLRMLRLTYLSGNVRRLFCFCLTQAVVFQLFEIQINWSSANSCRDHLVKRPGPYGLGKRWGKSVCQVLQAGEVFSSNGSFKRLRFHKRFVTVQLMACLLGLILGAQTMVCRLPRHRPKRGVINCC